LLHASELILEVAGVGEIQLALEADGVHHPVAISTYSEAADLKKPAAR
jgi:hypothetical protein